ncbi:hypothetical protein E0H73_41055 [Kribbella pittospori]|uniref:Uncharacterized protein n=1 Tax=Kribbella pittospori TaxID=722689 RepID=A0A4R0K1F4_9ACTN|nr:hypothetical protein E0H73_41055 [Kribbella pittospori]
MCVLPEHRTIVSMLAGGSPVWFVAAVMKTDRHQVYTVGRRYGYPDHVALDSAMAQVRASQHGPVPVST